MALVGIGFAFSFAACDPGATKAGRAPDVHVQRNSLDAADPGQQVPSELAGEFDDCLSSCEAAPETCAQTCCEEVTGSTSCFVE